MRPLSQAQGVEVIGSPRSTQKENPEVQTMMHFPKVRWGGGVQRLMSESSPGLGGTKLRRHKSNSGSTPHISGARDKSLRRHNVWYEDF